MGMVLKHSELSQAIGIAPGQLTNWRKSGGMPFVADATHVGGGITYDLAEVFEWVRKSGKHQEAEAKGDLVPAMESARLSRSRRLKVDLDRRQKAGELVTVRRVHHTLFPVVRVLRDALLALPDRLSAILAATTDDREVHARLSAELRATLEGAETEILAVGDSLTDKEQPGGDSEE